MGCNALTMTVMPMDVLSSRFPPSRFHAPFGQRWPRATWADDKGSPRPDDEENEGSLHR